MTDYGPRHGEGWPDFDDGSELGVLFDEGVIGKAEEYGFDSYEEMYEFVTGTGQYEDRESWAVDEDDRERYRRALRKAAPKCPGCLEDINDYLEQGAMRGEINKDPTMDFVHEEDRRESHERGVDEVIDHVFRYECGEHPEYRVEFEVWERVAEDEER